MNATDTTLERIVRHALMADAKANQRRSLDPRRSQLEKLADAIPLLGKSFEDLSQDPEAMQALKKIKTQRIQIFRTSAQGEGGAQ